MQRASWRGPWNWPKMEHMGLGKPKSASKPQYLCFRSGEISWGKINNARPLSKHVDIFRWHAISSFAYQIEHVKKVPGIRHEGLQICELRSNVRYFGQIKEHHRVEQELEDHQHQLYETIKVGSETNIQFEVVHKYIDRRRICLIFCKIFCNE